jgi:hypothetical protein
MDYARFGKQIALEQLAVDGQHAIAQAAVRFVGDSRVCSYAEQAWKSAGGTLAVETHATGTRVDIFVPDAVGELSEGALLALGAAAACDALGHIWPLAQKGESMFRAVLALLRSESAS